MAASDQYQAPANLPLNGVRILDLTHHIAGPFATRLLAAYGAEVLKIERPGAGDPARLAGPFPGDAPHPERSGRFLFLNTGKQSLALDLKSSAGRERFLELARSADAVVENFSPRVLPSLGLDWRVLHELNPRLVLVSISNFGRSGPYRDHAGTNLTLFAAGGQMAMTGDPDRPPLVNGGTQALMQAGLHGFSAAVTAIFGARRNGTGAHVDISIQEVQAASLEGSGPAALVHGFDASRTGNLMRALWGIYPCADGFVGCACLDRNVPNLFAAMGRPDLLQSEFGDPQWRLAHDDAMQALLMGFFLDHTRAELMALAEQHRVPFGLIPTIDELVAWPALRDKGFWQELDHPDAGRHIYPGAPFTLDGGGFRLTRAPRLNEHGNQQPATGNREAATPIANSRLPIATALPLEGVRILDLTMVWAGPYSTRLLADMGADVIKVEGVANVDLVRGIGGAGALATGERPWDRSPYFNEYNRNKRGVTLDLGRPEGRKALLELVRTADALIENYRADVLDQLGLGPAALQAERPDLVVVSMPAFSKRGSERRMVGYGPTIEQMGGLTALTGYEGGPPHRTGISYGDPVAGIVAAGALVMALLRRDGTGQGAVVEVSQRDNLVGLLGEAVLDWSMNRRLWPRRGNRHAWMAPHGVYPSLPLPEAEARPVGRLGGVIEHATDRWVAIAVASDEQWQSLCGVIGRPELAGDARFATADGRHARQDELDEIIASWTSQCSDHEAMNLLQACGVPAEAVRTPLTVTRDPHLAARDFFREVEHLVAGRYRVAGPLWNLSEPRVEMRSAAPAFGQHTNELLGGLLGMSVAAVAALREAGITADAPLVRQRVAARQG